MSLNLYGVLGCNFCTLKDLDRPSKIVEKCPVTGLVAVVPSSLSRMKCWMWAPLSPGLFHFSWMLVLLLVTSFGAAGWSGSQARVTKLTVSLAPPLRFIDLRTAWTL